MLTNPKFDLKLVATRKNGEQLELVRSFTLNDAETRGGLFCEIGRAAIGLYDDLERFVADEKARGARMNQVEQMREALRELKRHERVRTFAEAKYWLDQYKLFAEQALAAEPAKLVRLDKEELYDLWKATAEADPPIAHVHFAHAIMDAMEKLNNREIE